MLISILSINVNIFVVEASVCKNALDLSNGRLLDWESKGC